MTICAGLCALFLGGCGGSGETHLQKGMEAVARQEYRNALAELDGAIRDGEDKEQAYRGMGLAYMGQQEYAKALASFSKALGEAGIYPGETEYDINYYMAICYYKLGAYDEAIGRYDAITDLKPKEPRAWYLKGNMQLCLEDMEGAKESFEKAVAIRKNDYALYIDIYAALMQHGLGADAAAYLEMVDEADPKTVSDYDKGRLCFYRGEYTQAGNYLERAREYDSSNTELITLLGTCYKQQGQMDKAASVYQGFAEEHNNAQICNQLGLCYAESGDYEQALAAFRRGKEIRENNTCMQTLRYNEIACCEYLQDYEGAAALLQEYMEVYGKTEKLEKEYAFLTTR